MKLEEIQALMHPLYKEAHALADHVFRGEPLAEGQRDACAYLVKHAYDVGVQVDPVKKTALPPTKANLANWFGDWPEAWRKMWQLPEPFNGDLRKPMSVAFVSVNPGIAAEDDCPRYGKPFDAWLQYYLGRFAEDGSFRAGATTPLYKLYQDLLLAATLGRMWLGNGAFVTDLVQYKARKSVGHLRDQTASVYVRRPEDFVAAAEHCLPTTIDILEKSGVHVVVTVGADATRLLAPYLISEMPVVAGDEVVGPQGGSPGEVKLEEIHGQVFRSGGIAVIPSLHPGAQNWRPEAHAGALVGALEKAL